MWYLRLIYTQQCVLRLWRRFLLLKCAPAAKRWNSCGNSHAVTEHDQPQTSIICWSMTLIGARCLTELFETEKDWRWEGYVSFLLFLMKLLYKCLCLYDSFLPDNGGACIFPQSISSLKVQEISYIAENQRENHSFWIFHKGTRNLCFWRNNKEPPK